MTNITISGAQECAALLRVVGGMVAGTTPSGIGWLQEPEVVSIAFYPGSPFACVGAGE